MDNILYDLDIIFYYLDGILVFSIGMKLAIVFQCLANNIVTFNLAKLVFCNKTINVIGHRLNVRKNMTIRSLTPPKTVKALHCVVGIFNFYHTFHAQAVSDLPSLNALLKSKNVKCNKTPIMGTDELLKVFKKAKETLESVLPLHYINKSAHN